jgi:hypothetical protein
MHVPVFRGYNAGTYDHIYTRTSGEGVATGYNNEGAVFYVGPTPCTGG